MLGVTPPGNNDKRCVENSKRISQLAFIQTNVAYRDRVMVLDWHLHPGGIAKTRQRVTSGPLPSDKPKPLDLAIKR
jgi:hypothetical protein